LVVNGQLYGEGRPAVAEIGHLRPIVPSADEDAVTVQTTVESRASGLGIVQTLNALAGLTKDALANPTCHGVSDEKWQRDLQHIRDMMADLQARRTELTARDVARLAQQGNRLAQTALDTAIATLGWAIAQVITLLAPQVVVVGGGVAQMGETLFFEPLRRAVDRYVFPPLREHYQIRPAALGEQVVVIGAVLLAAQRVPA
jgi:glucokinase